MTRLELEKLIEENSGKWTSDQGIEFTQEDDRTIHAESGGMNGFIIHNNPPEDFHFSIGFRVFDEDKMSEFIQFVKDLATVFGITPKFPGMDSFEKVVKVTDNAAEERLSGKIEAYEKLLIGRDLTISK